MKKKLIITGLICVGIALLQAVILVANYSYHVIEAKWVKGSNAWSCVLWGVVGLVMVIIGLVNTKFDMDNKNPY